MGSAQERPLLCNRGCERPVRSLQTISAELVPAMGAFNALEFEVELEHPEWSSAAKEGRVLGRVDLYLQSIGFELQGACVYHAHMMSRECWEELVESERGTGVRHG